MTKAIIQLITILLISNLFWSCSSDDNGIEPITQDEQGEDQESTDDSQQTATCIDWQAAYGGASSDILYDFKPTLDGGFLISGASSSNSSGDKSQDSRGGFDFWIVKINGSGSIIWEKTLGGTLDDLGLTGITTTDGGYLIGGHSKSGASGEKSEENLGNSDIWIAKLDSSGNLLWENSIGGDDYDEVANVTETLDGGFVLGGSSASLASVDKAEDPKGGPGDLDYWLIKIDSLGNILWEHTIGGSRTDRMHATLATSDGGYLLVGSSVSDVGFDKSQASRGSSDFWIVKTNAIGEPIWDVTFGGASAEIPYAVLGTLDGGFIVTGETLSDLSGDLTQGTQGGFDYLIIKLNSAGGLVWQNTIGGTLSDHATALLIDNDGNYLIGGRSDSNTTGDKTEDTNGFYDYWVVKLNTEGSILDQKNYGGNLNDRLEAMTINSAGKIIAAGHSKSGVVGDRTEESYGEEDFWILQLSCVNGD